MHISFSERKTRVVTQTNDSYVAVDTVANFLYRGFHTRKLWDKGMWCAEMWRRFGFGNVYVLLHARSNGDIPVSWRWRSCGGPRPKWARARTTHLVWSNVSVGLSACAQTRTRANVNIRPRSLEQRTGKEKKRIRESEKERERWTETHGQRDKERRREGEGDSGEKERRVARFQIFNTEFFCLSQDSVPRSAHHGVRPGEARVHVEGRAGQKVWARDDARHRACKGKTEWNAFFL